MTLITPTFKQNYISKNKYRLDLGLSSNPLGASPHILQELCKNPSLLTHYPEAGYPLLLEKLATFLDCNQDDLFLGAGLDGLIYDLVGLILKKGDELIIPQITFRNAIYAASNCDAEITQIPMLEDFSINFDGLIEAIKPNTRIIFICNPNNPTGIYEPVESIIRLLQASPNVLVIVDEANIEYAGKSSLYLTEHFHNLLVLRTFSKAYGLAGMRIGYGVSKNPLLKELSTHRPPFCISSLSAFAAILALEDQQHLKDSITHVRQECNYMLQELKSLKFIPIPSQSNTLLCRIPSSWISASDLIDQLHHNDCHAVNGVYFNLSDHYLRIAPRLHAPNVEFISVLKNLL